MRSVRRAAGGGGDGTRVALHETSAHDLHNNLFVFAYRSVRAWSEQWARWMINISANCEYVANASEEEMLSFISIKDDCYFVTQIKYNYLISVWILVDWIHTNSKHSGFECEICCVRTFPSAFVSIPVHSTYSPFGKPLLEWSSFITVHFRRTCGALPCVHHFTFHLHIFRQISLALQSQRRIVKWIAFFFGKTNSCASVNRQRLTKFAFAFTKR